MSPLPNKSVSQCWKDIETWFKEHAQIQLELLQKGTTKKQIANFETILSKILPNEYKESLLIHDGSAYLTDYQYLSLSNVKKRWKLLGKKLEQGSFADAHSATTQLPWWDRAWIPFAEDSGGNLICMDLSKEGEAKIIYWEVEEGPVHTEIPSFHHWLAQYCEDLYNGVYKVDKEGFISEKS